MQFVVIQQDVPVGTGARCHSAPLDSLKQPLPDSYTWQAGRIILGIGDSTMHRFTKAVLDAGLVAQGTDKTYRKVEVR